MRQIKCNPPFRLYDSISISKTLKKQNDTSNMNINQIQQELAEKFEKLFPKGERCQCGKKFPCRSRGLVFFAWVVSVLERNKDT